MHVKAGIRIVAVIGGLILTSPLGADGPGAPTACANEADDCFEERGSFCLENGKLSMDRATKP